MLLEYSTWSQTNSSTVAASTQTGPNQAVKTPWWLGVVSISRKFNSRLNFNDLLDIKSGNRKTNLWFIYSFIRIWWYHVNKDISQRGEERAKVKGLSTVCVWCVCVCVVTSTGVCNLSACVTTGVQGPPVSKCLLHWTGDLYCTLSWQWGMKTHTHTLHAIVTQQPRLTRPGGNTSWSYSQPVSWDNGALCSAVTDCGDRLWMERAERPEAVTESGMFWSQTPVT